MIIKIARALGFVPLGLVLACGGGGAKTDGGTGGIGQVSGSAGVTGGGGATGLTGGGGSSGLPACAVVQPEPAFADCSDFAITGDWVTSDRAVTGDGGIYLPGGEYVAPMGGAIADGDYDLVKSVWGSSMQRTRRTMRVFDGGAYIAWAADNDNSDTDAGVMHFRANTTAIVANNVIAVTTNCGTISSYSYTASGEQLLLFNFSADALFTYQQRCRR